MTTTAQKADDNDDNDDNDNDDYDYDDDVPVTEDVTHPSSELTITTSVKIYTFFAALNMFKIGYDIGVSATAGPWIKESFELNDKQFEIFMGIINYVSIVTIFLQPYFADTYGRTATFAIAAAVNIIGQSVMVASISYTQLVIGRAIVGVGYGLGIYLEAIYITEIAPAKHRGTLVNWSELGQLLGLIAGYGTKLFLVILLADTAAWQIMCCGSILVSTIILYGVFFVIPESPRWLVLHGNIKKAKLVLGDIYPRGYNIDLIIDDIKMEAECMILAEKSAGWSAIIFPTPAMQRALYLGWSVAFFQQLSGRESITYYCLYIQKSVQITSEAQQSLIMIGFTGFQFLASVKGGRDLDVVGRRLVLFVSLTGLYFICNTMLVRCDQRQVFEVLTQHSLVSICYSFTGMAVGLMTLSLSYSIADDRIQAIIAITGLFIYYFTCGYGCGPIGSVLPSEVFPNSVRAKAMTVVNLLHAVLAGTLVSTFLTAKKVLSWSLLFIIFAMFCLLALLYFYIYLPEINGKTLEDMLTYFAEITNDYSVLEAERKILKLSEQKSKDIASGSIESGSRPDR